MADEKADAVAEERNPQVMAMVREQLERVPPPPLAALYGRAVLIDPDIRSLTPRQFNAKYALLVRRRMKREERQARRERRKRRQRQREERALHDASPEGPEPVQEDSAGLRKRIREILFEYAKVVAAARTKVETIDAIVDADRFAKAVLQAVATCRARAL